MTQVYDPRVQALIESNNPALIARDWLYGDAPMAAGDEAYWITMANYCEEQVPECQSVRVSE